MGKKTFWILLLLIGIVVSVSSARGQLVSPKSGPGDKEKVNLDFDHVDIKVFIKFMSKITGKNFVLGDNIRGQVTIVSPSAVSLDEACQVFEAVLQINGLTPVDQGEVTKIIRSVEARHTDVPLGIGQNSAGSRQNELITQVIPLHQARADMMRKTLVPLISKHGLLVSYSPTDILIAIDYAPNIKRILKIVSILDQRKKTAALRIFQLKNAGAVELAQNLKALFQGKKKLSATFNQELFNLVPDQRTNSLLVLADQADIPNLSMVIKKLDSPTPEALNSIQVVTLKNAQAEDLANVLTALAGQKTSDKKKPIISKNVSIVADKASNSLVIIAEPKEFQALMPIIRKLDSPRKQVFVEAAIIEVSSDKTFNLGVNWQAAGKIGHSDGVFYNSIGQGYGIIGTDMDQLQAAIPASSSGLSFGLLSFPFTYKGEEFFSLSSFITASQQDNAVHIISTPQLMTMENEEAKVVIAENRPFVTKQETTDSGNDYTNYEYKDVGVTLKVTPLINELGWIKLNIYQEVSRIDPNVDFNTTTPITRKRTAETTVTVKDGQTVVIAGLMENKTSNNKTKVPLLGDIPILGNLFKTTTDQKEKTNLLVFITPHIVQDKQQIKKLTQKKVKLIPGLHLSEDQLQEPILEPFKE